MSPPPRLHTRARPARVRRRRTMSSSSTRTSARYGADNDPAGGIYGAGTNWLVQHILKNPGVADGKLSKLLEAFS